MNIAINPVSYTKLTGMKILLFFLLTLILFPAAAQQTENEKEMFPCQAVVIDKDTVPVVYMGNVSVNGSRNSVSASEARQWDRLVKNVKVAYPYARLAGIKFREYSDQIAHVTGEQEKKAMMKKAEDELQAQFGNELKDLTITQGHILLKLIDRQTSNCSYDILVDFRGKFRAFFYQSIARIFGYNLKVKYDPLGEDADIERIVLMIENGTI
jgi:hypothetical protein